MASNYVLLFQLALLLVAPSSDARTDGEKEFLLQQAGKMLFQLYTRDNPLDPWDFELNDLDYLQFSPLNTSKPTKILTHGWHGYYGAAFNILLRNAFLIQLDVNVIIVSWDLESTLTYWASKDYAQTVGQVVALMVDLLCSQAGVRLEDVHVIGHSLGAQIAGISGLHTTVGKLPRVTGLDPAGPMYSMEDEIRISPNSADFVDVMHTARGIEGFNHEVGHVDFYPNDGVIIQPGCGWDYTGFRSHQRAYWLYASSILNPEQFLALQCDSWETYKSGKCKGNNVTEMGYYVSTKARGRYYLKTTGVMPYSVGNYSLMFN
ncbi:hypothetical protein GE061_013340 [Apolygus lucorum]|uniref:Lipase domain-containing protein n=1 Tax=Apolygus lucorum TaxID=248454 RepID=A0A8S9XQB7_APOLU|nr:hypothetical protein GE061_013340 [Apolygus lucorum]